MRRFHDSQDSDNFSTALPLAVIGSTIFVLLGYLLVMGELLDVKRSSTKVYVPLAADPSTDSHTGPGRTVRITPSQASASMSSVVQN